MYCCVLSCVGGKDRHGYDESVCVFFFLCCVMLLCALSIPLSLCVCMARVCLFPPICVCVCVCDIREMHYCQIASPLQCSLLRRLRNVITNHTWRASWHSHKVRMKYENDYEDLRLYYHDFLIIASLIYFCLLSLSPLFFHIFCLWLVQKWNKKVSQ